MDFSIIVPCYNEGQNLTALAEAFRRAMDTSRRVEVLLVDNGSKDDSWAQLNELGSQPAYSFIRPIRVCENRGYGWGILSGLAAARGEFLAWTHADLQTDPADVFEGWRQLLHSPDPHRTMLRGVRIGRPWMDVVFTQAMGYVASLALGTRLYDINAQPKIFHRQFLQELGTAPADFSLDLYVLYLAHRLGYQTLELPVHFGARQAGIAKGGGTFKGKIKLCKRTWRYILQLRRELKRNQGQPQRFDPSIFDQENQRRVA